MQLCFTSVLPKYIGSQAPRWPTFRKWKVSKCVLLLLQDERQRIEDLGGCVVWFGAWRVNGSLSVSRAIGDAEHKPYISGEPDVMEYALEGTVYSFYKIQSISLDISDA